VRTRLVFLVLLAFVVMACAASWAADGDRLAQVRRVPTVKGPRPTAQPRIVPVDRTKLILRKLPDLQVELTGSRYAVAGKSLALTVRVLNKGTATAPGTERGGKGYMVDLVLSSDADIPMKYAVWPGYAGKTADDFLEDMLLRGGRISNTRAVPAMRSTVYRISVPIPKRTPPGVYCLGAVVDPGKKVAELNERNNTVCHRVLIRPAGEGPVRPPSGVWIMPYAVGGTPLYSIKSSGRTDYWDSLSGRHMINAPFGSRLGFRHDYHNSIPTKAIAHYRWLFKRQGSTTWEEFTEPVRVRYVREKGTQVSYPSYPLGPKSIAGKNLYEFKPHKPPTETGATTYWPASGALGDIYSGFWNTVAEPWGLYAVKLEIFDAVGRQVGPSRSTFRFIVPSGKTGDTINTRIAAPSEIDAGGYKFALMTDNRQCHADIDPPAIGSLAVADECGFLLYTNKVRDRVTIAFSALHPANDAVFRFRVIRGVNTVAVTNASAEVAAATAGPYTGDGHGNFTANFRIPDLLGPVCTEKAAFSENLHVYAKATNGWHRRLNNLDGHFVRAFALAPK